MTIEGLPERWKAEETVDHEGLITGYLIEDRWFKTMHHVTLDALSKLTLSQLAAVTAAGKDVDHISRVTGYFSHASRWNKGKQAELRDRARVKV